MREVEIVNNLFTEVYDKHVVRNIDWGAVIVHVERMTYSQVMLGQFVTYYRRCMYAF